MALSIGLGQIQLKSRSAGHADPFGLVSRSVLYPGIRAADDINRAWTGQWTAFTNGPKLQSEIERLHKLENAARMYQQAIASKERELNQLRTLVGLPNFGRQHVNARIIGYYPNNNRMALSVGLDKGIAVGMPVLGWQGLVGIVETVDKDSCNVVMVYSPDVAFGGMVQRDPEVVGLMKGQTTKRLVLDLVDNGKVDPGDPVVTSGLSARIPRGIPVGTVAEVVFDPNFGTRRVFVAPSAQIGPTLEVTVLK